MRLGGAKQLVQGTETVGPGIRLHQDAKEDLGSTDTESPEGRQGSRGDSPDPQNSS